MNRRKAIQNIALITSGIAWMPACNFESRPVYENVPLERNQYQLIQKLTEVILPKSELEITTPETTTHFVLTMINDCFAPEDIQSYLSGLQAFQNFLKENYSKAFGNLENGQQIQLLDNLAQTESTPEDLQNFLGITKHLTVKHFTSSEFFLKNYLSFEFAPARYRGCVEVAG